MLHYVSIDAWLWFAVLALIGLMGANAAYGLFLP